MKCFWDRDGVCKHPKLNGVETTEERCRQCSYFSRASQVPNHQGRSLEEDMARLKNWEEDQKKIKKEEYEASQSFLGKAASWAKAEISQVLKGPVDDETYRMRLETCNACFRIERTPDAPLGFCTACGCGRNARAELTIKGRMPEAKCPIGAWGNPAAPRTPLPDTSGR
jgi:hypothetical protein